MAAASRELAHSIFPQASAVSEREPAVRVLLLDEEGHVLRVLRSIIESQGFEVVTALTVDAALLLVLDSACDVLIISGELANDSARHICECTSERLGDKSPLVLILDNNSGLLADQYPFARSLSMPFNCKAIVDCLAIDSKFSYPQL